MKDDLPEINFKEKKEKKRGALGWLRSKFGGGSGGAMGQAGLGPSAMNVGRALGAAKFGASSGGLAGLLAGKLGIIATVAVVAAVGGLYVVRNAPAPAVSTGAFSSGKTSNYVPTILRGKDQGSSLDMFKDTNKGSGLAMETNPNATAKKAPEVKDAAAADATTQDPNQLAGSLAEDIAGKLQGAAGGSLTSSLGGGSSKFSGMGGFGNKFGQGATGAKAGFSSGIGTDFGGMPKFDSRKNKMLAMKGSARPVFSGAKSGGKGLYGPKSYNQAKGLRNMQKTYTGKEVDQMRSTQDKAWTGSTAEGDVSGGAGLNDGGGGAGIMTSPSLDNGGSGGGGGGGGTPADPADPVAPPANPPTDESPWADLVSNIMMLVLLSAVLAYAGAYIIKAGWWGGYGYAIGLALCIIAAALAAAAMVMSTQLMTGHGQEQLGGLYLVGGVLALIGAIVGMTGATQDPPNMTTMGWLAAGAGIISLIGSMLGGK